MIKSTLLFEMKEIKQIHLCVHTSISCDEWMGQSKYFLHVFIQIAFFTVACDLGTLLLLTDLYQI